MNQPLLEWHQVKRLAHPLSTTVWPAAEREPIGCWSTRKTIPLDSMHPTINNLGFDVAFTRFPHDTLSTPTDDGKIVLNLSGVVRYIDSQNPTRNLSSAGKMQSSILGHRVHPEEQLTCIDNLQLATSSGDADEWLFSWAPAWRFVGRYLLFMHNDKELAKSYISRAFGVDESDIPPVCFSLSYSSRPNRSPSSLRLRYPSSRHSRRYINKFMKYSLHSRRARVLT